MDTSHLRLVLQALSLFFALHAFAYNPSCYETLKREIQKLPIDALRSADAIHPSTSNVLEHFVAISKISRPSGHEGRLRAKLIADASAKGYFYQTDRAGNLLIRIPSNEARANKGPTLLLQAHMDIVPKVKGISKLEDAVNFYHSNQGVMPLEWNEGVIQSINHHNTIGADNGSGVAMMMEYMHNPQLRHPPLELLFTVEEETGLQGIDKLEIPLTAKYAISLDSGSFKDALIGSLGSARFKLVGPPFARKPKSDSHSTYRIQLSGLDSGHSGMAIGLGRANAVIEMKNLLLLLKKEIPEFEVITLTAGSEGTYNAIPNEFNLELAMPPSQLTNAQRVLRDFEMILRTQYAGIESFKDFSFDIAENDNSLGVMNWENIEALVLAMSEVPNGPQNSQWPSAVQDNSFSSNTAFLVVDTKGVRSGLMPRFSEFASFQAFETYLSEFQMRRLPNLQLSHHAFSHSWSAPLESDLNTRVMNQAQRLGLPIELSAARGGVEASLLAQRYPEMQIIVIGAQVDNAHEASEAMPLLELAQAMRLLDDVVTDLANNP